MRHYAAICLCLLLGGCLPPRSITDKPVNPSPRSEVAKTSEKSGREYLHRLSDLCRQQSDKADEFKSYAELFNFGHAGEAEARKAFESFEAQLTIEINPADPYKPAAVRRVFAEAASGFDTAAGSSTRGQ